MPKPSRPPETYYEVCDMCEDGPFDKCDKWEECETGKTVAEDREADGN